MGDLPLVTLIHCSKGLIPFYFHAIIFSDDFRIPETATCISYSALKKAVTLLNRSTFTDRFLQTRNQQPHFKIQQPLL
jgi:hypothetical protein